MKLPAPNFTIGAQYVPNGLHNMELVIITGLELYDKGTVESLIAKMRRDSDLQLMKFYQVDSLAALIDAQEKHIKKLQLKLEVKNCYIDWVNKTGVWEDD